MSCIVFPVPIQHWQFPQIFSRLASSPLWWPILTTWTPRSSTSSPPLSSRWRRWVDLLIWYSMMLNYYTQLSESYVELFDLNTRFTPTCIYTRRPGLWIITLIYTGALPVCRRRPRRHGWRRPRPERSSCHELPRLAVEEALAER